MAALIAPDTKLWKVLVMLPDGRFFGGAHTSPDACEAARSMAACLAPEAIVTVYEPKQ